MSNERKLIIGLIAYILAAICTYAWRVQRTPINQKSISPQADLVIDSGFAGLMWPIYWTGKLALAITKPAQAEKAP